MPGHVLIPVAALTLVIVMMLGELQVSRRHERILRAQGAVEPPDPVYATMKWAYPAVFVAMAVEGALVGIVPGWIRVLGIVFFAAGKLVKYWAIATLGVRWTYRVLVLPGAPLVGSGPYRLMRHPNYVGVLGELVGMLFVAGAFMTGPLGTVFFCWLLWRRVETENRALGRDPSG
jgi:methyltransferase